MEIKSHQIHDRFFKESLERKQLMQGFLRLLLKDKIHTRINYKSLQIEKETWIDSFFKRGEADVLIKGETDTKRPILILLEHKSFIDDTAVFQNIRNSIGIMEEQIKASGKKKIPHLFVVIVYHGNKVWPLKNNSTTSLFEVLKEDKDSLPLQRDYIIDLSVFPDNKLNDTAEVNAFILSLKYSRSPLLFQKLPMIINQFVGTGIKRQQYLKVIIDYLYRVISKRKRIEFSTIVDQLLLQGDYDMKKFSDIFEEMGYRTGESDQKQRDKRKIKHKENIIKKKENIIKKKENIIKKKEGIIKKKEGIIKEKENDISRRKRIILVKQKIISKRNKTNYTTVLNLLKRNFSAKEISLTTGLPLKTINKIINKPDAFKG